MHFLKIFLINNLNPHIGALVILERNKNKNKTKNDCQGTDSTFTRLEWWNQSVNLNNQVETKRKHVKQSAYWIYFYFFNSFVLIKPLIIAVFSVTFGVSLFITVRAPIKRRTVLSRRFRFLCTLQTVRSHYQKTHQSEILRTVHWLTGLVNDDDDSHDPLPASLWTGVTRTTSS